MFGSTGNFTDLGNRGDGLDNILYGVKDKHYPYFNHLNGVTIPKAVQDPSATPLKIDQNFIKNAHKGANDATLSIGAASVCQNVTGNDDEDQNCPLDTGRELGWCISKKTRRIL